MRDYEFDWQKHKLEFRDTKKIYTILGHHEFEAQKRIINWVRTKIIQEEKERAMEEHKGVKEILEPSK